MGDEDGITGEEQQPAVETSKSGTPQAQGQYSPARVREATRALQVRVNYSAAIADFLYSMLYTESQLQNKPQASPPSRNIQGTMCPSSLTASLFLISTFDPGRQKSSAARGGKEEI